MCVCVCVCFSGFSYTGVLFFDTTPHMRTAAARVGCLGYFFLLYQRFSAADVIAANPISGLVVPGGTGSGAKCRGF